MIHDECYVFLLLLLLYNTIYTRLLFRQRRHWVSQHCERGASFLTVPHAHLFLQELLQFECPFTRPLQLLFLQESIEPISLLQEFHHLFLQELLQLECLFTRPLQVFFYQRPSNPLLSYKSSTIFFYKNSFNLNVFWQGPSNFFPARFPLTFSSFPGFQHFCLQKLLQLESFLTRPLQLFSNKNPFS